MVQETEPLEAPPPPSSATTALTGTMLRSLELELELDMTATVLTDLTASFRGRALRPAGERTDGSWAGLKGRECGVKERRDRR